MCVIIDTCVIHSIFDETSQSHNEFRPVFLWLKNRDGKMILGGTKYKSEMGQCIGKYRGIMAEFDRKGKLIKLNDDSIDKLQSEIEKLERDRDFDDPHLIAIVIESGCRIVCTDDKRSIKFITDGKFYSRSSRRPKIYSKSKHVSLIRDKNNIADICKKTKKR